MVDKQIRIDITAKDDASDQLEQVADAVADVEGADPEITVEADTSTAESALADVESAADEVAGLTPEITVEADTSTAESALSDVEADADALAGLTPEITVDADTSAADSALADTEAAAETLTAADQEIILKAKVSDATAALKTLRGGLDDTSKKADDVKADLDQIGSTGGPRLAGNAMSDLTGPLGDASGAAGDFGGVLDGVSDIAETMGTKLGLSEQATGTLTSSLGLAGFAVAGVAAGIAYFSGKAEEAKKKQEELTAATRDYNDALAEGDYRAAADQLVDLYEDAFDAADKAGVPTKEFVDYITGITDEMPSFERGMQGAHDALGITGDAMGKMRQQHFDKTWDGYRSSIDDARRSVKDTNGIIATQNRRIGEVSKALGTAERATKDTARAQREMQRETERLERALDNMKGALDFDKALQNFEEDFREAYRKVRDGRKLTKDDILTLKDTVLNVGEFAKMHPAVVRSLLRRIERGDIAGVRDAVQTYMDTHTVQTPAGVKLIPGAAADAHDDAQDELNQFNPIQIPTEYAGPTGTPPWMRPGAAVVAAAAAAPVTNVTMYLPRGYRERDVVTAARSHARRSGGLYRRTRR
ncbi:MAG: hypothetical protein EHM90_00080 [Chloroflexi bacterium]|nr:MAG: hypothetical protein EHM90_00080 [Chloroflexota bacterium]